MANHELAGFLAQPWDSDSILLIYFYTGTGGLGASSLDNIFS